MVLFNGVSRAHLINVTMQRIVELTNMELYLRLGAGRVQKWNLQPGLLI